MEHVVNKHKLKKTHTHTHKKIAFRHTGGEATE